MASPHTQPLESPAAAAYDGALKTAAFIGRLRRRLGRRQVPDEATSVNFALGSLLVAEQELLDAAANLAIFLANP